MKIYWLKLRRPKPTEPQYHYFPRAIDRDDAATIFRNEERERIISQPSRFTPQQITSHILSMMETGESFFANRPAGKAWGAQEIATLANMAAEREAERCKK